MKAVNHALGSGLDRRLCSIVEGPIAARISLAFRVRSCKGSKIVHVNGDRCARDGAIALAIDHASRPIYPAASSGGRIESGPRDCACMRAATIPFKTLRRSLPLAVRGIADILITWNWPN